MGEFILLVSCTLMKHFLEGIAMLRFGTLTQMRRSEKVQIFSFEFTLPKLNRAHLSVMFNQDTCSMQKAPLMSIQISAFNKVNDWASLNSKTKCCGIVFIRLCIVRYSSQAIFFLILLKKFREIKLEC